MLTLSVSEFGCSPGRDRLEVSSSCYGENSCRVLSAVDVPVFEILITSFSTFASAARLFPAEVAFISSLIVDDILIVV